MTSSFRIVIAVGGPAPRLAQTLLSLSACTFPDSYRELFIVENGDKSGIEELVADAPENLKARYLYHPEANKSAALNYALSFLQDDCLVYLTDDDICFSTTTLVNIDWATKGRTNGVVLGGAVNVHYSDAPPEWMLRFMPFSMRGWNPSAEQLDPDKIGFLGANWAVFVGDVRCVGGFDTRFGPGSPLRATGQETQIQRLLRRTDVKFEFVQNAEVWHFVDSNRFDSKFIADRHLRMGIESGIYTAIAPRESIVSVLRVPYKLLSNAIKLCCSGLVLKVIGNRNTPAMFSALTSKHRALGFFKGFVSSVVTARTN